jgi:hypothetical protein
LKVFSMTDQIPNTDGLPDGDSVPNGDSSEEQPPAEQTTLVEVRSELLLRQARFNDATRAVDAFHDKLQQAGFVMTQSKRVELYHLEVALNNVREANLAYVISVAEKFGFPDDTKVGLDAAKAAWGMVTMIDHLEAPQVRSIIEPLLNAPLLNESPRQFPEINEVLYLVDFCLVILGFEQRYGTLWYVELGAAAALLPYPIEDIANVDKRRKEVGAKDTLLELSLRIAQEDEFETPVPYLPIAYMLGIQAPGH